MSLTKKEYFDLLVKTSADGGFPAVTPDTDGKLSCVYRGTVGDKTLRCAVGLLIPDDKYLPSFENRFASNLFTCFPSLADVIPNGLSTYDLQKVQRVHDDMTFAKGSLGDPDRNRALPWNHDKFVTKLRELEFFADMS